MFDKFNDLAKRATVLAQREARFLGHDCIGTGDLLLGLTLLGEGNPVLTLEHLGVTVLDVRASTISMFYSKDGSRRPGIDRLPLSAHAKEALELSFRESLSMKDDFIGPEHLLVGLVRGSEGVAAEVFRKFGISLDDVRAALLEARSTTARLDQPSSTPEQTPVPDVVVVVIHKTSGSAESRLNDLRQILPPDLGETRVQVIDGHAGLRTVYPLSSGLDLSSLCFAVADGPANHDDALEAVVEILTSMHLQLDVDGSVPNFYLVVLIADRSLDSSSKPTELTRLGTDVVYLRAGNFGNQLQPSEMSAEREGSLTLLDLRYSSAETVAEVVASAVARGVVRVWREMRLGGG